MIACWEILATLLELNGCNAKLSKFVTYGTPLGLIGNLFVIWQPAWASEVSWMSNMARVIAAILSDWCLRKSISLFAKFEWVAQALLGPPNSNLIFQIMKLSNLGQAFIETKPTFFVWCPGPPTYLVINNLQQI